MRELRGPSRWWLVAASVGLVALAATAGVRRDGMGIALWGALPGVAALTSLARWRGWRPRAAVRGVLDAPCGMFVADPAGVISHVNGRFTAALGVDADDVVGGPFLNCIVDEIDRGWWRALLRDGTGAHTRVLRLKCANGGARWFELTFDLHRQPEPVLIGALRDVEDEKLRERTLEGQLAGLRSIVDASPFAILTLDDELRVTDVWNPSAERIFGWKAESVRGRYLPLVPQHLASPDVGHGEAEVRRWRADGTPIDVRVTMAPLEDGSGPRGGYVAIVQDVTTRRRADDERRRLGEIVEGSPDLILMASVDGKVLYANPTASARLGLASDDDRALPSLHEVEWSGRWTDEIFPAVAETGLWHGDAQLRAASGEPFPVSEVFIAHRESTGRLSYISLVARDVTQQRQTEEQLRQSQKLEALGTLSAGVAHDFNNLLTIIQISAEELERTIPGHLREAVVAVADAGSAVARGRDLVRHLMAFGRRQALQPRAIDVVAVLRNQVRALSRLLPESIDVQVVGPVQASVFADPAAIEQIVLNLATNARDAMPDGGVLEIRVECPNGSGSDVLVSVRDNGVGMPETIVGRVFEPFFTTKEPGKGTGLGLAMVYGLMGQLGGSVEVASRPGEGSTFTLRFPGTTLPLAAAQPASLVAAPPTVKGTEAILLVEDEEGIRRVLTRGLSRLGYTVHAAADGMEALDVFRQAHESIHLVLSDLVMPRLSGDELFARVRELGSEVPFVFMTGYTSEETRSRIGRADAVILEKPWTMEEVARRIREVLDADGPTRARGAA